MASFLQTNLDQILTFRCNYDGYIIKKCHFTEISRFKCSIGVNEIIDAHDKYDIRHI